MNVECLLYVTTTPGLEHVCEKELQKFPQVRNIQQCFLGALIFRASPFMDFSQVKSIFSLNAFIGTIDDISQTDDVEAVLERFREYPLLDNDLWTQAFHMKHFFDTKHHAQATSGVAEEDVWSDWSDHDEQALCPLFRVSCTRKKEEHFPAHKFSSVQAAGHLGFGIGKRYPQWKVDLKQPQVDIIFHIRDDKGVIAINLLQEKTISQRNRSAPLFDWITALAPPTAFSLCALLDSHLSPGMVVCDPMCGIGTIPIEGALAFPHCVFIGGELNAESVQQARANEQWTRQHRGGINSHSNEKPAFAVEILQWNAGSIPLRSGAIDVIICDMPFGMKHGNYRQNRKLYPVFFEEMLRLLSDNGKMLLLTLEIKLVRKTLAAAAAGLGGQQHCLYEHSSLPVTIGGYQTKLFDIRKTLADTACT